MLDDQLAPAAPHGLTRSLGVAGVLFLTLSVATPASSVFVIVPGMLQVAGSGALWAMLIAGMVCVATAFIYAELSSAWPVAGGVVATATLVALLRIRVNAVVTGAFLLVEVAALALVAGVGLAEHARPLANLLADPMMPHGDALAPASPAAIGLATSIAIFALNGYGAAVYFGEEMLDAPRRIARTILIALVLTLLLEIAPLLTALLVAPDLHALAVADDPFGTLVAARFGTATAGWVAIGVAVTIANAVIACILACARFFYGTARDGSWGRPVDRWLGQIHPRLGSPAIATLVSGGVGVACCFMPLTFLLVLSGTGLVAIYAGISLAAIVGRRTGTTGHAGYRMPLYPLAPIVTLLALAYVVWTSWSDLEEGRPGLIATAAQIAAAAAWYSIVLRRRPGGWLTGSGQAASN